MLEKTLYNQLFSRSFSLPIEVSYWDGTTKQYEDTDTPPQIKISIHEEIPIKEITSNTSLALGKAYIDHRIEIEGSIQALINDTYQQANGSLWGKGYLKWLPKKEKHTKQKNKEDTRAHYNLGNDFYKLWLDPTLTYSCAYFNTPEDTLERAQINEVHHILDKLFIKEGETLLDVGCGRGTLMFTATKEYNAKATGTTLSEGQYDLITKGIKEEHLEDKCRVLLMDYRKLKDETFDHITSVGMFEHVGSENLEGYFKVVKDLLKPEGTALIHGISRQQGGATSAWVNKYISPGGYVSGVTELVDSITKNDLQLTDLENLRRDYQLTLEYWTKSFHQVQDQVTKEVGDSFYRIWDLCLQARAASFELGNINVIQYLLVQPGNNDIPVHRT